MKLIEITNKQIETVQIPAVKRVITLLKHSFGYDIKVYPETVMKDAVSFFVSFAFIGVNSTPHAESSISINLRNVEDMRAVFSYSKSISLGHGKMGQIYIDIAPPESMDIRKNSIDLKDINQIDDMLDHIADKLGLKRKVVEETKHIDKNKTFKEMNDFEKVVNIVLHKFPYLYLTTPSSFYLNLAYFYYKTNSWIIQLVQHEKSNRIQYRYYDKQKDDVLSYYVDPKDLDSLSDMIDTLIARAGLKEAETVNEALNLSENKLRRLNWHLLEKAINDQLDMNLEVIDVLEQRDVKVNGVSAKAFHLYVHYLDSDEKLGKDYSDDRNWFTVYMDASGLRVMHGRGDR